mgnify:CR=1 FL=1
MLFRSKGGDELVKELKGINEERKANLPGGEVRPEAAASNAVNMLERSTKDASAALGSSFGKLNSSTGELINSFGTLSNLYKTQLMTPDQFKKTLGIEGIENAAANAAGGRAGGSLDATGKLIEDFGAGTMMQLHGKEGVITQEQLNNLMKPINIPAPIMNMTSAIPQMPSDLTDIMTKIYDSGIGQSQIFEEMMLENSKFYTNNNGILDDLIAVSQQGSGFLSKINEGIVDQTSAELSKVGVTPFQPPTSTAPTDFFESVTPMFYEIGNVAGTMFDNITNDSKKTTESVTKLAAGSDAAAIKNKYSMLQENVASKSVMMTPSQLAEKKTAQETQAKLSNLVTSITKQQAETAKQTAKKDAAQSQAATAEKKTNTESKNEPQLTTGNVTLNDLKDQLIELNKNVKDLIIHTDRVAGNTEKQAREMAKNGSRI